MNPKTSALLTVLIIVVIGGAVAFSLKTTGNDSCSDRGTARTVTIHNGKPSDTDIQAKLCDTLTFINKDSLDREIAFGPHDHHVPYDGISERLLTHNQSFAITLNKAGRYHWHDHDHDEVGGYFTVAN